MSYSSNIKSKCVDRRILKRLPEDHQPRDFVRASKVSQDEFYGGNQVLDKDEQPERKLTIDEKNKLAAKILRAEMFGDVELATVLRRQLESTERSAQESVFENSGLSKSNFEESSETNAACSSATKQTVLLTKTDFRSGLTYPVFKKHAIEDIGGKKRHKHADETKDFSVKDLLELEKFTTAEDQLAMFGATSAKVVSRKTDDSFTVDDAVTDRTVKKQKCSSKSSEQNAYSRAVEAHKKVEQTLENCLYCIDSKKLRKHLIVAAGLKTYLAVPAHKPLVDLQCSVIPMSHVSSCVQMDEDVYDEMKIWRKGLVAMYRKQELDVVFIESAKNVRYQPHTYIECYPVPADAGHSAPMYFKKAILECEEEWAQNKKLVDLSKKELRKSIPRGFSYFAVDFGLQSGYAHAIENESNFGANFGQEIIGGMLDLDATLWCRPNKQTFEEQLSRATSLKSMWTPYDWTERVKQSLKTNKEH